MSILDGLISVVKTASPLIATALGGPLSGIAVSLLGNIFGSTSKNPDEILNLIKNDPDAALKIKRLEYDHSEELARIASDDYKTEVDDRKDARKMMEEQEESYKWFLKIFAIIITLGFFLTMFAIITYQDAITGTEKEIMLVFVGVLTSKWQTIVDFFFGSSKK